MILFLVLTSWVMGLQSSFGPLHFAQSLAVIHNNWDELKYILQARRHVHRHRTPKVNITPLTAPSINSQKIVSIKSKPKDYCYLMKPAFFLAGHEENKGNTYDKTLFPHTLFKWPQNYIFGAINCFFTMYPLLESSRSHP